MTVKWTPEGHHTVTPYLIVKDAAKAIEFYREAFGAEEVSRLTDERSGLIVHAKIRIGSSLLMLNDEFPEYGAFGPSAERPSSVTLHLYVEDVDASFARAVDAGATPLMPVAEQFWGDRFGVLMDPFGHKWSMATHVVDLTPEEIAERARHAFG